MRRVGRLLRIFLAVVGRSIYIQVVARFLPAEDRPGFRAKHQQKGAAAVCRILGVKVSVHGTWPNDGEILIVSNHLGLYDAFILASRIRVVFAAKEEMRRWPIAGFVARAIGIIFVSRDRRMETASFVQQVRAHLKHRRRVLIFPEGTTGDGSAIQPFKTGGFEAVAGQRDGMVLPVFLGASGSDNDLADEALRRIITWADPNQSMAANAWALLGLSAIHFYIQIGEPISAASLDRKQLANAAHEQVSALARATTGYQNVRAARAGAGKSGINLAPQ